ncbi:UDP-glucose 4-epimerase GalE [Streptomyces sp. ISL-10]|uniref:UDP-glucose 4-epimerase GalE n=1 Tax=Streptomyces sp. ISL-10 TaxID=2819172 RepID=UPI001BE8278D|nr:UDP-glucose 4-epimerase GalE [Streptomyces sp. ISL-10]MBT2365768.1 UDP-glucose 4-epimerase GalE [Streptomyces sp. ISL-10]
MVTGATGFIGSHTCVELLDHGYQVVVVDDFSNSSPQVVSRIQRLAGRFLDAVYKVDVRDRRALSSVFDRHRVDAVVHFAAKKAVGESVRLPVEYYDVNVGGTTALLATMHEHGVRRLVFSSSCSIYGDVDTSPLTEQDPARPSNPYAASKWTCEQMLADVCRCRPDYTVLSLRYFNPVGAHPSGLLGEAPLGEPDNLMPYLAQVAAGRRERLRVFGSDYATADGTGVRDYIHVMDVAEAHRIALEHLGDSTGLRVFNLGVGSGTSVFELLTAFGEVSGKTIPYEVVDRRPGDVTELVADPSAVTREWGWRASRDLAAMCRDAWRFQRLNPTGYAAG